MMQRLCRPLSMLSSRPTACPGGTAGAQTPAGCYIFEVGMCELMMNTIA
jgi:hypothetical protein